MSAATVTDAESVVPAQPQAHSFSLPSVGSRSRRSCSAWAFMAFAFSSIVRRSFGWWLRFALARSYPTMCFCTSAARHGLWKASGRTRPARGGAHVIADDCRCKSPAPCTGLALTYQPNVSFSTGDSGRHRERPGLGTRTLHRPSHGISPHTMFG